jgi:hypothetical protein
MIKGTVVGITKTDVVLNIGFQERWFGFPE